jgi:hypothetical protein
MITINVPAHLQPVVGSATSDVLPVHLACATLKAGRYGEGLVYVYEPRRECYYWVKQSVIYPKPAKRW